MTVREIYSSRALLTPALVFTLLCVLLATSTALPIATSDASNPKRLTTTMILFASRTDPYHEYTLPFEERQDLENRDVETNYVPGGTGSGGQYNKDQPYGRK
ncbi:hypothetical protein EDD11_002997 [Mortierella claussenii]|nr:hypothetical protein EDD11_002997 [Mortierella claussenii]